jgi:hypothetical protein
VELKYRVDDDKVAMIFEAVQIAERQPLSQNDADLKV